MQAFISHSYFTDTATARCLNKTLEHSGITCYDHHGLSNKLKILYTGGSDLDDLIRAYREGGRPAPTQEVSDPGLHKLLVEDISKQDIMVVLWSEQYSQKFWTQRELKIALSFGVPLIIVMMDNHMLNDELQRGVSYGNIPLFGFGIDFNPKEICHAINNLIVKRPQLQPKNVNDEGLNRTFIQIQHPSLGPYEIAESYFTFADMKRFISDKASSGLNEMDIGGNISNTYINDFCHFISQQSPFYRYRLPTESEWEFAARAGSIATNNWMSGSEVDRDGVPAYRNAWGMWFVPNALEWTSTQNEWHEYLGWVQPLPVVDNEIGPDRSYVIMQVNGGHGRGGFHPHLAHKKEEQPRLGFRLVREKRLDINLDQVLPTRHRNLAKDLLLIRDPDELRTSVCEMIEYGTITRYFREYLEHCILQGTWDMAESLLVQILMITYVPPVTLPPYLHDFFRQSLCAVFDGERIIDSYNNLLKKLEEMNLLGREFAEVLLYDFGRDPDFKYKGIVFDSCWQECIYHLPEKDKELLFRFCDC